MTDKEIDVARRHVHCKNAIPWNLWSEDDKRLDEELSCRSMINSCLAYGGIETFWREDEWRFHDKSYAAPYIKSLGLKRVKEIANEQCADFAKATIVYGVATDGEGCTYNSVIWNDEPAHR